MVKYTSEKFFQRQRPIKTQSWDRNQIKGIPSISTIEISEEIKIFQRKDPIKVLTPRKSFQLDKMAQEKEHKVMAHLLEHESSRNKQLSWKRKTWGGESQEI